MPTFLKVINIITVFALIFGPFTLLAQEEPDIFGTEPIPEQFEERSDTLSELITKLLTLALSIVGLVAVLFVIYGGFKYITSGGEEEKSHEARATVINALIGLVLALLAFTLVRIIAAAITAGEI